VLGRDLWALVRALDVPLLDATLVSRLPAARTGRASFRLVLEDGRIFKGRCTVEPREAARIAALMPRLPRPHFPRCLGRRGRALLVEWLPGAPLRPDQCTEALLHRCGALHATIHRVLVPSRPRPGLRRRPEPWETRLDGHLRTLVSGGALSAAEARAARGLAQRLGPAETSLALCHGDLCRENIVTDAAGHARIIDNETVALDACDYDLARTWYRWPMTSRQRAAYLGGYGDSAARQSFAAHVVHWALIVLAESAAYRLRVHPPAALGPIRRLRGIVARPSARLI
jgi:hypothetical protein